MLRVIAGKHKGLVLNNFELNNVRPTVDRVKEAVFSKIQFDVPNAVVLDLFAGTGNYGIEALSRGAKEVIFADANKNSVNLINKNLKKCGEKCEVLNFPYEKTLQILNERGCKFDIIFLDPPFEKGFGELAIKQIENRGLLSENGVIVYEHAVSEHEDWKFEKVNEFDLKKYGTIYVSYFTLN